MNDLATALEWSRKHVAMLRAERSALADLLQSLAEFERRALHRDLGYATLFDYLHRELSHSRGMSHYRQVAVRLVQRFPEVVEPIRDGSLCLTTVVELARVITDENRAEVLPRFLNRSREEAKQVAAEIAPREVVPRRTVVTVEPPSKPARVELTRHASSTVELGLTDVRSSSTVELGSTEVRPGSAVESAAAPPASPRTRVEPMTATETRLHLTVSPEFVALLRKARAGQSHVQPGATDEQVLTAALELLLARQARRTARVPARVKREVVRRDGGRCQWPTHDGGTCGSTVRLEIDHVVPRGKGGPSTVENGRLLCRKHNLEAARQAYGDEVMEQYAAKTGRAGGAGRDPVARESCAAYFVAGAVTMSPCRDDPWERRAASS